MTLIRESAQIVEAVKGTREGVYRVRLISEGPGSSGFYPAEVLEKYIPDALPENTLVYLDHTDEEDDYVRGGTRSYRDVAGRIVSTPVYNPADKSVEAEIQFVPGIREDLEVLREAIGLSIEIHAATRDEDGIITELNYHRLNSVALVPVPGRDGRVLEKLAESFRVNDAEDKEDKMEISKEQLAALVDETAAKVIEALTPLITPVVEEKADEDEGPTALEMATALAGAGLTENQMARVAEDVANGKELTEAIEGVKALVAEALEASKSTAAGGVLASEGASDTGTDNEAYFETLLKNK